MTRVLVVARVMPVIRRRMTRVKLPVWSGWFCLVGVVPLVMVLQVYRADPGGC